MTYKRRQGPTRPASVDASVLERAQPTTTGDFGLALVDGLADAWGSGSDGEASVRFRLVTNP